MPRPLKDVDESDLPGQVAARIRARRLKLKLSVDEAAERAGVSAPGWYHWEKGESLPLAKLRSIAEALECSMRSLLPPD
jgi:transcriptional regulator with XRE-family HTH domain